MKILYQHPEISDEGLIIRIIQQNPDSKPVVDLKRLINERVYNIKKFGIEDLKFIKKHYEEIMSILIDFIEQM